MDKLEAIFHDLIHQGFHIDEYLSRFFFVLEKRLAKLFENIDTRIIKMDVQIEKIPEDF